jgi:hypothetical protein
VFLCSLGALPAVLKDLTCVETDVARRAAQPGAMIHAVSSVLHPNVSHTYGVVDVEGLCGVVASFATGVRLSQLPVNRIRVQVSHLQAPHEQLRFS